MLNGRRMSPGDDDHNRLTRSMTENETLTSETSPLLRTESNLSSYTESQNHFGDVRRGGRRPFHYLPLRDGQPENLPDGSAMAVYNRLKYYNRLCDPTDSTLRIPDHVVPHMFFYGIPLVGPGAIKGDQSSLVTIFVIWNTMVGTSLLSMPWAIGQAGFLCGIALMVFMATLCFYTAYRILCVQKTVGSSTMNSDFIELCGLLLGPWGSLASIFFSLSTLLGAVVVCWILCSNFLYNTVVYIYDAFTEFPQPVPDANITHSNVLCPSSISNSTSLHQYSGTESMFFEVWNLHLSVPLIMVLILGPLVNVKSPDFFARFSAFGTLSVMFLIVFVSCKAATWGFHLNFENTTASDYSPYFKDSFFALTGTLSLSLFIHNCIISIMRNQKNPDNNARDLGFAYILVTVTYLFVGAMFYAAFPLAKSCIADNLLDNIGGGDVMAFVARLFLFFQILTVCPLLYYIFRIQFMYYLFGSVYPGFKHVLIMNGTLITVSVLFAVFLPSIGTIIRFSGAFCGLAYIFALPCFTYLAAEHQKKRLTSFSVVVHIFIVLLGLVNFIAQFVYV